MTAPRPAESVHVKTFLGCCRKCAQFLFVGLLLAGFGGLFFYLAYTRPETNTLPPAVGLTLVGLGIALVPLGYALSGGTRRVFVNDAGLSWVDDRGRSHSAGWDEVRAVYRADVTQRGVRMEVLQVKLDGKRQLIADRRLSGYERLCDAVQRYSGEVALNHQRAALQHDGAAQFDAVTLRRDGLTVTGTDIGWDELEQWTVHNGSLHVFAADGKKDSWALLLNIRNYQVLLQMLEDEAGAMMPPGSSYLFRRRKG